MYLVHEKFKDVFVEILEKSEDEVSFKVRWWNLGFTGNQWLCPVPLQWIDIWPGDLQWIPFDPRKPETHPGRING